MRSNCARHPLALTLGLVVLALSNSAAADPPTAPATVSFLALPFVGFHSYQNGDMAAYAPGLRAGAMLGARLRSWVSVNVEGTYDRSYVPFNQGPSSSEFFADFALSPLIHFLGARGELVVGPEIGYFLRSASGETQAGLHIDDSSTGLALGLNAGVFAAVGRHVSLGVLLSLELRNARRYCQTLTGQPETCTADPLLGSATVLHDADLFALTLAALF